jgi:oligo-1,6-glucosidase
MTNIDMPNIEDYVDISALGKYKTALKNGQDMDVFMELLNYKSRENGRTPMQWNTSKQAGFTDDEPWKRVNPNYININVATQNGDPNSILNHFRKMTQVRKENLALVYGKYHVLQKEHPNIYAFTRTWNDQSILVLLNFSESKSSIQLKELNQIDEPLINNYGSSDIKDDVIQLQPYQAIVLALKK